MVSVFDVMIGKHALPVMIINLKNRSIVSVPTQIGCAIGCSFCISSQGEFVRNLTAPEMVSLVTAGLDRATNKDALVSFTGEGEPFLNLKRINKAITLLEWHDDISAFRLCTSGIRPNLLRDVRAICKPVDLQLSLHSPFDDKRMTLIPRTKPVANILSALREHQGKFREVAINYVLMADFNDSKNDLLALSNIIEKDWVIKLNPLLEDSEFEASNNAELFFNELSALGHEVKLFNKIGSVIKNEFYDKLSYEKHNAIALSSAEPALSL